MGQREWTPTNDGKGAHTKTGYLANVGAEGEGKSKKPSSKSILLMTEHQNSNRVWRITLGPPPKKSLVDLP